MSIDMHSFVMSTSDFTESCMFALSDQLDDIFIYYIHLSKIYTIQSSIKKGTHMGKIIIYFLFD